MDNLLIIGYGNLLHSDEGIGWYVAQLLATRLPESRVITTHQLTSEMADRLSNAEFAVFFDGFAHGEPGELHCESLVPDTNALPVIEPVTPTKLLTLTRLRDGYCPPALLLTLAGLSFNHGNTLSPLLHQMLHDIVDDAAELIRTHMARAAEEAPAMPYLTMD